ncbi:MAG TPA: ISL3 family transposase [Actinomycetota bacterium]
MDDRIDVPLQLDGFEVTGSELVGGTLEVSVRPSTRRACHHCGSVDVIGHGHNDRRIRDRACGFPTVLVWRQRRVRCKDCGRTSRERHRELAPGRSTTNRFRRRLFERACNEPFTDVAASEDVTAYRVVEAFDHHSLDALAGSDKVPPRVVAIDESAFKRRFQFHTVLSDPERGIVLDLVEGRHKGAVFAGLMALSDEARAHIETVVIDCFWPYRRAVEELLPEVRLVADKFHVIRSIDAAAQRVRMRFGRREWRHRVGRDGGVARQHNPASDPAVFGARWVFMKRAAKLTDAETAWMHRLFDDCAPEIAAAWWLKEEFAANYSEPDRASAERRLDRWIETMQEVGLPEFINTWRTLQWWREPILNYFDDRVTNAFAEGITNKIKVMKRRSYGFRDPARYRRKVLISCRRRRA